MRECCTLLYFWARWLEWRDYVLPEFTECQPAVDVYDVLRQAVEFKDQDDVPRFIKKLIRYGFEATSFLMVLRV